MFFCPPQHPVVDPAAQSSTSICHIPPAVGRWPPGLFTDESWSTRARAADVSGSPESGGSVVLPARCSASTVRCSRSLGGCTDLPRLENAALNAMRPVDQILGAVVRTCTDALGPGLCLLHVHAQPDGAQVCVHFLKDGGTDPIDWPPPPSDLDPGEHLWDRVSLTSILAPPGCSSNCRELGGPLVEFRRRPPPPTLLGTTH